jgi:hypothetical protein
MGKKKKKKIFFFRLIFNIDLLDEILSNLKIYKYFF